jgi:hypothetical protein
MNHYRIRYNTLNRGQEAPWRVFENDQEYLLNNVYITVPTRTECREELGQTKYNIACEGYMRVENGSAYISNTQDPAV